MVFPIGLSPNIELDDVLNALSVLVSPWKWYGKDAKKAVLAWFQQRFSTNQASLFISGRSALTALLQAFDIGDNDEVIIQAFTCMVVPNAIRFAGATPVYVDIDTTGTIDVGTLERSITKKTKCIVVQHTFGTRAHMDEIMSIAKKHHCIVIEDCAHALGAFDDVRGDAAFFSFGRDKCISSVFGGVAIVNARWSQVYMKLNGIQKKMPEAPFFWIWQQVFHPIATGMILPLYSFGIGKLLLVFFQKLKLLSFPVSKQELSGMKPKLYFLQYPNALAMLALLQLKKLDRYTKNRQDIAAYYEEQFKSNKQIRMLAGLGSGTSLRFSIMVSNQSDILSEAKKRYGLVLGHWYSHVIDPVGSNMNRAGYKKGSCPQAEKMAQHIINLPTRISKELASQIVQCINSL